MMAAAAMLAMLMMVFLMMMAAATMVLLVVMFLFQCMDVLLQRVLPCHSIQDLLTGQLRPGSGHQYSMRIVFPNQCDRRIQLCLGYCIGTGQNNGLSCFDLIIIELAKILHVDLDLANICNGNGATQYYICIRDFFHSGNDIAKLANTGGFNHDPVGMVLFDHLGQCLAKIAYQAAADTAGVHLSDVDTGILQKTAVNADLTKFIFNQHKLFSNIGFLDHFLDQRCLTCAKKTRVNVNFSHNYTFCFIMDTVIIPRTFSFYNTKIPEVQQHFGHLSTYRNQQHPIWFRFIRQLIGFFNSFYSRTGSFCQFP